MSLPHQSIRYVIYRILLQICDLQLIVMSHWLLERILKCVWISAVFFKNLFIWTRSHASKLISEAAFLISSGRISCLKVLTFCFYKKALHLVKWLIKHDILTILNFYFIILSSSFRLCWWKFMFKQFGTKLPSKQKKQYGIWRGGLVSNCVCVWSRLATLLLRMRMY